LAYLSAAIADLVAALLSQGAYAQPLVGQTVAVLILAAGREKILKKVLA
jgi:hypothetical protein